MPVIPVLGKRRWEDSKFKAILGCMVSCYLPKSKEQRLRAQRRFLSRNATRAVEQPFLRVRHCRLWGLRGVLAAHA